MQPTVLLISGRAGSGKTTFANMLCEQLGQKATIQPIAQRIKQIARMMGWDGRKDRRGRALLIALGQIGREYDPDVWIKQTVEVIDNDKTHNVFIIDDWRFRNEYQYVCTNRPKWKIITVHMQRNWTDPTAPPDDPTEKDLSEWTNYDWVIDNNGTLKELATRAKEVATCLITRER